MSDSLETEHASNCIACDEPMKAGDLYFPDESGGEIHAACAGPEREAYTLNGEPLGPNDPIPEPYVWEPWPAPSAEGEGKR